MGTKIAGLLAVGAGITQCAHLIGRCVDGRIEVGGTEGHGVGPFLCRAVHARTALSARAGAPHSGCPSTQASPIAAQLAPFSSAISRSRSNASCVPLDSERPSGRRAILESDGKASPRRYLPVKMPPARGEYGE